MINPSPITNLIKTKENKKDPEDINTTITGLHSCA